MSDGPAIETFRCENPGEKWTRRAQRVIRDAASLLEEVEGLGAFVAVDDAGRLVGAVIYGPAHLEHAGAHALEIFSLGVVSDRRREKIGSDLKLAVLAESAALGVPYVVSQVHKSNTPMMLLNESLGVSVTPLLVDEHRLTAARVRLRLFDRMRLSSRQRSGGDPSAS